MPSSFIHPTKTSVNRSAPVKVATIDAEATLRHGLLAALVSILLILSLAGAARAETPSSTADPAVYAGNDLYKKKCYVCHDVRKERINRAGPSLYGVVGRKAGTMPGFPYTPGMKIAAEDGMVWDEKTLDAFLANPQAVVPGTAMVKESALPKKEDRAAMIAYLKLLKAR